MRIYTLQKRHFLLTLARVVKEYHCVHCVQVCPHAHLHLAEETFPTHLLHLLCSLLGFSPNRWVLVFISNQQIIFFTKDTLIALICHSWYLVLLQGIQLLCVQWYGWSKLQLLYLFNRHIFNTQLFNNTVDIHPVLYTVGKCLERKHILALWKM
jgi:hypothetical protein